MQQQFLTWWKEFRNICLCRLYIVLPNNIYPFIIIPKVSYIFPINIDELSQSGDFVIVRRSNKTEDKTFDEIGYLREDALISKIDQFPNLSMNILGGKFKTKHIKYKAKIGIATERWNEKERVLLIDYRDKWETWSNAIPIYFSLNDIHNIEFPYLRDSNDKETKKLKEIFSFLEQGIKTRFIGKTFVEHEPIKLNYWHVELKLKDVRGDNIEKTDSAWKKTAAENALKDILLIKGRAEILKNEIIPDIFYKYA
jgi:hypothetical protein